MDKLVSVDDSNVLQLMNHSRLIDVYAICKKPAPEWLPELFAVAKPQVASSASAAAPSPKISAPKKGAEKKDGFQTQKKKERKPKEEKKEREPDADPQGTQDQDRQTCGGKFKVTLSASGEVLHVQAYKWSHDTKSTTLVDQRCLSLGGFSCKKKGCPHEHFCPNEGWCNCRAHRMCTRRDCEGTNQKTGKPCGHWHTEIHGEWGTRPCDQ